MINVKFNETFSPKTFPSTEDELWIYIERKMDVYLRMEANKFVVEQAKLQLDWILKKAHKEGVTPKKLAGRIKINREVQKIEIIINEEQETRIIS